MQKNANKKKNAAQPVYKPYLKGTMFSGLAAKRGLKVFALIAIYAFFGLLASGVFGLDTVWLRVLMNGVLVAFGCMLMFNEGAKLGEGDVAFAEIALRRQEDGTKATKKELDACYHPGKGLASMLIGVAPFLILTILYALVAKRQTYALGALPSWVQSYEVQDEIGQGLAYYHQSGVIGLADVLRLLVRLVLFPYMNMLGGGDYDRLFLLDRLSPLLVLIIPAFYAFGYTMGPRQRALVHGNIRMARRRHNRNERKAREQRARKVQQKKELI